MSRRIVLSLVMCLAFAAGAFAQDAPASKDAPDPEREKLEKQFAESMTNATMVGHFTVTGKPMQPREDRYTIVSVKKMAGDLWVFNAKMSYGGKDAVIPLPVPVKWAGDTPVISVTDMKIPGMGSYTARVLIYRGEYAGTWSAGDHGGLMFGRIERGEAKPDAKPAEPAK
jgi:hypothetical protein